MKLKLSTKISIIHNLNRCFTESDPRPTSINSILCLIASLFSVDLWEDKFIDCKMENTSFEHNKHGCHLDTFEENDVLIYLVSFLGSLAVLPGNIISALFMEKIGRVKIIGDFWKFFNFKS